ncbi:hypothetical protein [Bacteroides cellulosilyticus]|uniref:hypothetical protein n=1 Tax=Bacteroides cellulosilyticus TaxID=246787 RepID=UPI001898E30D|nr:hypothetical protein [Bacteroides cellulosilyticus]
MNKEKENKNAEISARIANILQYTGDTRNSFAIKLGYERAQTVYDVINMKSAPSYDFFRRFSISEYSDIIDLKWLLSGEGSMLRDSKNPEETTMGVAPNVAPTSPAEESIIYKMYEKKDEEVKALIRENGRLEERIRQLESQDKESGFKFPNIIEDFTSESSGDYGEGYSPTKPHTTSKRSSVGKI